MKKNFILAFLIFISLISYSQVKFEKGYFINNNGKKTDCFIKNPDRFDNLKECRYKLSEDSEVQTANIHSIKEFGSINTFKYIRAFVKIDQSSEKADNISNRREPEFIQDTLFLKTLVEGKASLYFYGDGYLLRYFYSIDDSAIEQLIFKTYFVSQGKINENNTFRQQLQSNLKCECINLKDLRNTNYRKSDLTNYFLKYNNCVNSDITNYEKKQERKKVLNINIRPGITLPSVSFYDQNSIYNIDFHKKISFRIGVEAEYILPFYKNKWSIIFEPTYQYYKNDIRIVSNYTTDARIDYKSIEIPLGIRHYFYLNNNSKLFLNASIIYDYNLKSSMGHSRVLNNMEIETKNLNLGFGLGYNYKNKYSAEFRYKLNRQLLKNYMFLSAEYSSFSFIIGYNLR